MNCPNCGTVLPQGMQNCPACGTFLPGAQEYAGYSQPTGGYAQGFDPGAYGQSGYPQGYSQPGYSQNGFSQGYDPAAYTQQGGYAPGFDPSAYGYQQGYGGYPQGYQPVYGRYNTSALGDGSPLLSAVAMLPRVAVGVLQDPGETLQGMLERNDRFSGAIVAALSLLLTFLTAMVVTHGGVSALLSGLSSLFGLSLAGDAASMNQGVSYIAGKIAVPVGGIAVLCQVFSMVFPAAVALVYLCAMRKVRFSFLLASNVVALATLPTVVASLLCMLGSLLSPFVGLALVFLGEVASYVILCTLIARITCVPEQRSALTKIAVICIAEILKLGFMQLIGGALLSGTLRTMSTLMGTMSSLL